MVSRKKQEIKKQEGETNLKQLRIALDMTQVEFAVAVGISPSTVAKCEAGLHEPSFESGSIRKLNQLMLEKLGYGVESLPDSLKEVSTVQIFA